MVVSTLQPPAHENLVNFISNESWRFRINHKFEVTELLLLELESSHPDIRRRRETIRKLERINEPRQGLTQFYFVLRGVPCIDNSQINIINALFLLIPHAGLGLLNRLLAADVI